MSKKVNNRLFTIFIISLALIGSMVVLSSSANEPDDDKQPPETENNTNAYDFDIPEEVVDALFRNNGLFREFKPEDEIKEKRDRYSKHFPNPDGTIAAVIGAGPVHYMEDGVWKTMLSHILPNNTNEFPDYPLAAIHNEHKMFFPEIPGKPIVTKTKGEVYEDWGQPAIVWLDGNGNVLSEIDPNPSSQAIANKDSLVYRDMFPQTDAVILNSTMYKKLNDLLKDSSILAGKPAQAVDLAFRETIRAAGSWQLKGVNQPEHQFTSHPGGQVLQNMMFVNASGDSMLEIRQPLYYEKRSDSDRSQPEPGRVAMGNFLIKEGHNSYDAFTLVPVDWLANRTFPVVIDPISYYYPDWIWSYSPTVTTYRGSNSGDFYCHFSTGYNRIYVYDISYGWSDDTWPTNNPYWDGDAVFNLTSIPDNACIFSTTYYWWIYYRRWCGDQINLKFGRVQNNLNLAEVLSCNTGGYAVRNNSAYYTGTGKNETGWQSQTGTASHVESNLGGNYISLGWAYNGGDDCCTFLCGGDDGNWQNLYGFEHSTGKPYVRVDYEGGPPTGFDKIWTGRTSTAWTTATNWCPTGQPTSTQRVYIPNTTNKPAVTSSVNAGCVTIHSDGGAVVTITSTGTLNIGNASCPTYP